MAENKKISQFPLTGVEKGTYKILIVDGNTNKIVEWDTLKDVAISEAVSQAQSNVLLTNYYDTGWLKNEIGGAGVGDWTSVYLGDDPTDGTDLITHGLSIGITQLDVKLYIAPVTSSPSDDNCLLAGVAGAQDNSTTAGITLHSIDSNNIRLQTGNQGFKYIDSTGAIVNMTNQSYYYRVVVTRLF